MSSAKFKDRTQPHTAYMRAQQEWDARMGAAVVHARNWRWAAFISLFGMLLSIAGLVYLAKLPKSVPYVIEIDKLGEATYRGELANLGNNFKLTDLQLVFHLKRFVNALRSVSSDNRVNAAHLQEAWNMVDLTGGNMVRAYIEGPGNPYKRAETEIVTIEVTGAVQISRDTWQVDWREKAWDRQGNGTRQEAWRGMFRILQRPPDKKNPSGLYVHELHWDRMGS